ncbi:GtrA family protein [Staphylococcus pseudintermedius]|uniref:GtrA family protein n=1 Tax=Staphylococcus pseudintermedius TaxID=283734 RepID=UPI0007AE462D|nr:GtrA family protein [Staphylococcus pseudintermedius]EGQ1624737.1 GtrA family protein [Staphylococcus pseudintermedius]EGQ1660434.1 GtrA family protein [Staphylococcus pseudintermedius]EGQ3824207.1 GtrA family protein [Staphylococcus pseudintermedius]EGQ3904622.1 GtrA family protein [Staphylococcus pseudintermedius]EGQ4113846.1 GtrA family protein [Staphylococcus pseudintermedius]
MVNSARFFEIFRFILVGGVNTLNYYIVYLILLRLFDVHYLISHIVGFIFSFVVSFYLNCYFVYKVRPTLKKFLAFPLTQVVNMGTQTLLIFIFVDLMHFNAALAPFVGLIVTIPITYILSKFILKDR